MASVYGTVFDDGGAVFNVRHSDYGAKGDGKTAIGTMTSGSATLTASGSAFAAGDVGKHVRVAGAVNVAEPEVIVPIAVFPSPFAP